MLFAPARKRHLELLKPCALNPQPEPKRQDVESYAEYDRASAKPPGYHQRADERRDDQQDTVDERGDAAEGEPTASMLDIETIGSGKH